MIVACCSLVIITWSLLRCCSITQTVDMKREGDYDIEDPNPYSIHDS